MAAGACIVIHNRHHAEAAAEAALAAGVPLTLAGPPGSAASLGIGWFTALRAHLAGRYPGLELTLLLHCLDEAGTAQTALASGIEIVGFSGNPTAAVRLRAIAAAAGARLIEAMPPALDVAASRDPAASCRAWLNVHRGDFAAVAK